MKNRDKLISFSHCYKQSWQTLFKTSLYFEFWSWLCGASISHPSKLVGSGLFPKIFVKSWKRFLFEAIGSREQWRFRYFSESQKRISMASKKYGSSLALLLAWKQSCRGLCDTKHLVGEVTWNYPWDLQCNRIVEIKNRNKLWPLFQNVFGLRIIVEFALQQLILFLRLPKEYRQDLPFHSCFFDRVTDCRFAGGSYLELLLGNICVNLEICK